jgi:hypothetical protein
MRRWLGLTILAIILYPAAESRGSQIRAQCVIGLNLSDEFAVRKSGNKNRKTRNGTEGIWMPVGRQTPYPTISFQARNQSTS